MKTVYNGQLKIDPDCKDEIDREVRSLTENIVDALNLHLSLIGMSPLEIELDDSTGRHYQTRITSQPRLLLQPNILVIEFQILAFQDGNESTFDILRISLTDGGDERSLFYSTAWEVVGRAQDPILNALGLPIIRKIGTVTDCQSARW